MCFIYLTHFSEQYQIMMYYELFRGKKPLIGMIHTNSTDEYTMLDLAKNLSAKREEILYKNFVA